MVARRRHCAECARPGSSRPRNSRSSRKGRCRKSGSSSRLLAAHRLAACRCRSLPSANLKRPIRRQKYQSIHIRKHALGIQASSTAPEQPPLTTHPHKPSPRKMQALKSPSLRASAKNARPSRAAVCRVSLQSVWARAGLTPAARPAPTTLAPPLANKGAVCLRPPEHSHTLLITTLFWVGSHRASS